MDQIKNHMNKPAASSKSEIKKSDVNVKASHLSSNPINGRYHNNGSAHFEVEVQKAFFKIFFGV